MSTTLVTFRIRAPAFTRTLQLYGSWDNFQRAYPMSKDLQSGSEYWSGCFNFSNIVCDGKPSVLIEPRDGGLRMGGTYWYYYKINNDQDFHNVCERATTNCPMLPGQLINILNIPYALSGNRSRNPSTSSTSSERRTMNPEDRFMNPRPAPAKPVTARVSTSPTQDVFSTPGENTTEQRDHGVRTHIPRKISLDSYTPNGITGGLRAAFRIRTARSQSPEADSHENNRRAVSNERSVRVDAIAKQNNLLFRSESHENLQAASFEAHRRHRSRSRSREQFIRHAASSDPLRQLEPLWLLNSNHQPLTTLEEVVSNSNTPVADTSIELPHKVEADLEKRLPTLPNTPSSAYPPSVAAISPQRGLDLAALDSHFSATTIDTEYQPFSAVLEGKSHFSTWTTSTQKSSILVEDIIPLPTNILLVQNVPLSIDPNLEACLPSSMSLASICSSISTTPSTSCLDTDYEFDIAEMNADRHIQLEHTAYQHYRLPADEYTSMATLKAPLQNRRRGRSPGPDGIYKEETNQAMFDTQDLVHSESMQQLLDELSYLSDMIQR